MPSSSTGPIRADWPSGRDSCAAQVLAQIDRGARFAKARDQIGGVKQAPVLAAAAHRDERHLGAHQITQRASAPLTGVAVARAQQMGRLHRHVDLIQGNGAARRGRRGSVAGDCEQQGSSVSRRERKGNTPARQLWKRITESRIRWTNC
jgi:hypothetical protein